MQQKYTDKNGVEITPGNATHDDDDVIFYLGHYFRVYKEYTHIHNKPTEIEMISCTYGYMHGVGQPEFSGSERIGKYKGNEYLFQCD